jgi:hypothetical protein
MPTLPAERLGREHVMKRTSVKRQLLRATSQKRPLNWQDVPKLSVPQG